MCLLSHVRLFSTVYNEGPGTSSGKKGQIYNLINVHKKVCIRCSLSSGNRWCLLFCYTTSETCSNMHLNYKHYPGVGSVLLDVFIKSVGQELQINK